MMATFVVAAAASRLRAGAVPRLALQSSARTLVRSCAAAEPLCPLPDGIVVVDKPMNWTSFDVVGKLRGTLEKSLREQGHKFGRRSRLKVGHGGTLDPMATGLLIVGVGSGCKRLQGYLTGAKSYHARVQLGSETDSQDSTGETILTTSRSHVTLEALDAAASGLTGEILQRPPIFSALRKDGVRMHELARKGAITEADMELRPATVYSLRVSGFEPSTGQFDIAVRCGGGTYVRSLIVELGRAVGSSAHMLALERTQHGPFTKDGDEGAVAPVTLDDFGNVPLLLEAMSQAQLVLDREARERGEAEGEAPAPPRARSKKKRDLPAGAPDA